MGPLSAMLSAAAPMLLGLLESTERLCVGAERLLFATEGRCVTAVRLLFSLFRTALELVQPPPPACDPRASEPPPFPLPEGAMAPPEAAPPSAVPLSGYLVASTMSATSTVSPTGASAHDDLSGACGAGGVGGAGGAGGGTAALDMDADSSEDDDGDVVADLTSCSFRGGQKQARLRA